MTSQSVVPSDGKGTECSLQVIDIVNTRIASRSTISSENSKRIRTVRANCFLTCVRLWDATQTATGLSDWVSKRSLEVAGRPWNLIWNKSSAKSGFLGRCLSSGGGGLHGFWSKISSFYSCMRKGTEIQHVYQPCFAGWSLLSNILASKHRASVILLHITIQHSKDSTESSLQYGQPKLYS